MFDDSDWFAGRYLRDTIKPDPSDPEWLRFMLKDVGGMSVFQQGPMVRLAYMSPPRLQFQPGDPATLHEYVSPDYYHFEMDAIFLRNGERYVSVTCGDITVVPPTLWPDDMPIWKVEI